MKIDSVEQLKSRGSFNWGLTSKTVLVTGASNGIGREFVRYLADAGATVVIAARRLDRLKLAASEIEQSGGTACAVQMDVRDTNSIKAAVDAAEAAVGSIDILINNAGISPYENALEQNVELWDSIQATNLRGPWFLSTEVARRMRDSGRRGTIVNISSIAGIGRSAFMASYCASKSALIQLTTCLALEFAAYGIRVNSIAPGIIETGMAEKFVDTPPGRAILKRIPLGRFGTPDDLKFALLWLCSDHSSYVNGTCIVVDGGLLGSAV